MKYLVTGINGLLGQTLASMMDGYIKTGDSIVGIGKGDSRLPEKVKRHIIYQNVNLTNTSSLVELLHQYKFDVIIHAASMTNVDACEEHNGQAIDINIVATDVLAKNAILANPNVFLLYVSTDFVFDGLKEIYTEEDAVSPVNFYGKTKVQAENIIRDEVQNWAIVRTVLVYGPPYQSGRKDIIRWVKGEIEQGRKMKIVDDQYRKPTYVEDLAWAIIQLSLKRMNGIYHVCGNDVLSPYEMAVMIAKWMQKDSRKYIEKTDSASLNQRAQRPISTLLSTEKINKAIGYSPTPFLEGIRKTMDAILPTK